jgi:hypothetical protein
MIITSLRKNIKVDHHSINYIAYLLIVCNDMEGGIRKYLAQMNQADVDECCQLLSGG